jgi:hypothetical protein
LSYFKIRSKYILSGEGRGVCGCVGFRILEFSNLELSRYLF